MAVSPPTSSPSITSTATTTSTSYPAASSFRPPSTTSILQPHHREVPISSLHSLQVSNTFTTLLKACKRRGTARCVRQRGLSESASLPSALLFDCDGVLVDTDKDGHRVSFNDTFSEKELGVTWGVGCMENCLKLVEGKQGWPEKAPKTDEERKDFVAALHNRKTDLFMALIERKLLPLRPGVAR